MGTFIRTDEPNVEESGVFIGHPIDWNSNPATGRVIGKPFTEKYDLGDTIKFNPKTLTEAGFTEKSQ